MNPVGMTGTHVSYETDANGNRVEVTYDSTGKILSSKKVGSVEGSEYNARNGSVGGGAMMNQSNWSKLVAILREKFGISI